jgi:protoporphyrinogen oxidase
MTELVSFLKTSIQTYEQIPTKIGRLINALVKENVEVYLDSLQDISPEEELRMINRLSPQADVVENKKYRDRLNSFRVVNKEVKEKTGQFAVEVESLENPLRVALIDNSILQLYKMSNEITEIIKDGKMDATSLSILVDKAVDNVTKTATLPEVKSMLIDLIKLVESQYLVYVDSKLEPLADKYIKTVVDGVIS